MNKAKLYQEVFEQMDKLYKAHKELNKLWLDNANELTDVLDFAYPYESCFNELEADVLNWVASFKEINNLMQNRENELLTNKDLETGNEDMSKSKLEFGHAWVNFQVKKTIKIGSIGVNVNTPCEIYKCKKTKSIRVDNIDGWDISSIDYNGIHINNYQNIKKFIEFHKEMGIDINEEVRKSDDELISENLTKIVPKEIINFINKED
jgi:hypothetical protein